MTINIVLQSHIKDIFKYQYHQLFSQENQIE